MSSLAAVHLRDLLQLLVQPLLHELGLGADPLEQGSDQPSCCWSKAARRCSGRISW